MVSGTGHELREGGCNQRLHRMFSLEIVQGSPAAP
jgi:hypothetical protein